MLSTHEQTRDDFLEALFELYSKVREKLLEIRDKANEVVEKEKPEQKPEKAQKEIPKTSEVESAERKKPELLGIEGRGEQKLLEKGNDKYNIHISIVHTDVKINRNLLSDNAQVVYDYLKKNPEIAKEVFTKIAKELIQNEVKQYNEINKKVISNINEIKSNTELNSEKGKELFNKLQNEEGKQYQKKLTANEVERNIKIVLLDKKGNDIIPVSVSNKEGKTERKDTKEMIRELKSRGVDISQVRNKKQIHELLNKSNRDNVNGKDKNSEELKKERKRESKEVEHEIG